jgi:hypothetical protein
MKIILGIVLILVSSSVGWDFGEVNTGGRMSPPSWWNSYGKYIEE